MTFSIIIYVSEESAVRINLQTDDYMSGPDLMQHQEVLKSVTILLPFKLTSIEVEGTRFRKRFSATRMDLVFS